MESRKGLRACPKGLRREETRALGWAPGCRPARLATTLSYARVCSRTVMPGKSSLLPHFIFSLSPPHPFPRGDLYTVALYFHSWGPLLS